MARLVKPYKWHGGKDYLAKPIISLFPPRCKTPNKALPSDPGWLHYVEPYFGGGSVLLANNPDGISELIGDTNWMVTNFWRVLQEPETFAKFLRYVQAVNFSEIEWADCAPVWDGTAWQSGDDGPRDWQAAAKFFVRARQSLAGRVDTKERPAGFTGITRTRTRRGMNAEVSAWMTAVEGLPAVAARMMRVFVRNRPAIELIRSEDEKRTLFYLDPPYLPETRATAGEYGAHEMTPEQHEEMLKALLKIEGRFVLSGYPNDLYDRYAKQGKWRIKDFDLANHAAGGSEKRRMVERVWLNF